MKLLKLVFAVAFIFCFSQCQQEFEVVPQDTREITSIEDDELLQNIRTNLFGKTLKNASTSTDSLMNRVNWGHAYKRTEEQNDRSIYTLPLFMEELFVYENLVLIEKSDELVSSFIIRYKPDENWLANKPETGGMTSFTGNLALVDLSGQELAASDYLNGERVLDKQQSGSFENCETFFDVEWTEVCALGDCQTTEITFVEYEVCVVISSTADPDDGGGSGGDSEGNVGGGSSGGGGGGTTPIDDGESNPVVGIIDPNDPAYKGPGRLCGYYPFDRISSGWTAQIEKLNAYAVHTETGEFLSPWWGAMCVTFPTTSSSVASSEAFILAWNTTIDEGEVWLNTQEQAPTTVEYAHKFVDFLRINLVQYAGAATLTVGPCGGGVIRTRARSCF
ncbi:MAG: hypothetical protein AAFX87_28425 [Bacteroidota bacterium]